jgi:hypothetical protein
MEVAAEAAPLKESKATTAATTEKGSGYSFTFFSGCVVVVEVVVFTCSS